MKNTFSNPMSFRFSLFFFLGLGCCLFLGCPWASSDNREGKTEKQGETDSSVKSFSDSKVPPDSQEDSVSPSTNLEQKISISTPTETEEVSMHLSSTAFANNEFIPEKYTGDGLDLSPQLSWTNAPERTVEFALICDDPDAPTPEPWVHWVIYKIPGTVSELPEGLPQDLILGKPVSASQGKNSWISGRVYGYRGPDPPRGHGTHHYRFTLYALDTPLDLEPGAEKDQLLEAMHGKILASAEYTGTYEKFDVPADD